MTDNPGKIFLVEDNMEVSRMYERAFRLRGHEVELVYDGETALDKIRASDPVPEAVILDVMIPHMNGAQLLKEIRSDPNLAKVPIAILTNSFHRDNADEFLALGADLYMVKIEHQSKQVVEKIEALIDTYKAASDS